MPAESQSAGGPSQPATAIPGEITILTSDLDDPKSGAAQPLGLFKKIQDLRYARVPVPLEQLQANLSQFLAGIQGILHQIPAEVGGMHLDSVTLAVEISAKGTVSLLGTGGELAGKGGLTFTLKR